MNILFDTTPEQEAACGRTLALLNAQRSEAGLPALTLGAYMSRQIRQLLESYVLRWKHDDAEKPREIVQEIWADLSIEDQSAIRAILKKYRSDL